LPDTQLRRCRLQLFFHQASSLPLFPQRFHRFPQRFHRRSKLYLHRRKVYLDLASSLLFSCGDFSKLTHGLI
jgi:hypothetical protein